MGNFKKSSVAALVLYLTSVIRISAVNGAILALSLLAVQAHANVNTLSSSVQASGTAPFSSSPGPGDDVSPGDQVIRTNDDLTYFVQMNTSSTAAATYVLTLPNCDAAANAGVMGCSPGKLLAAWQALPPQCDGPGSGISADKQVLTCVRTVSGLNSILPVARISPNAPNGASLPMLTMTATSADSGATVLTGTDTMPNVAISAAPRWDLSKGEAVGTLSNNSPLAGRGIFATGPAGEPGIVLSFPLVIYDRNVGGKGAEAMAPGPIVISDDLSNITSDDPAWQAAIRAQGQPYNIDGSWPNTRAGTAGGCPENSGLYTFLNEGALFDAGLSGSCSASQPGGPGTPVTLTISNPDFANTNDRDIYGRVTKLKVTQSRTFLLWVPLSALPPTGQHTISNTYGTITGPSISGQSNVEPSTSNNTGTLPLNVTAPGGVVIKYYTGVPQEGNRGFSYTTANTKVYSDIVVEFIGYGVVKNLIICDKLDNQRSNVAIPASALVNQTNVLQTQGVDYVVEYGSGGVNGIGDVWASTADQRTASCANDQSAVGWKTNADDAAFGHTPGTYDKITKFRYRMLRDTPTSASVTSYMQLVMLAKPTLGPNAGVPLVPGSFTENFATITDSKTSTGTSISDVLLAGDKTIDSSGNGWFTYNTRPFSTAYNWDRISLSQAAARIIKESVVPDNSATQAVGGSTVTYKLIPTLSSPTPNDTNTTTLVIEDILPAGASYVAGSAKQGASLGAAAPLNPTAILPDTPSVGLTTIRFELPNSKVNDAIAPIYLDARVSGVLPNGTVLANITKISTPLDPHNCDALLEGFPAATYPYGIRGETDAASTVLCPGAARKNLTVSSPPGFYNEKSVTRQFIEPAGSYDWSLSWIPIGNAISYTDSIDILPHNGDGRGTNFSGSIELTAIGAISGDDAASPSSVLCALSIPADSDPASAANWSGTYPAGAPTGIWSTANCAVPAAVKALRIRSNSFQDANVRRRMVISMKTSANKVGDIYFNRITSRGANLSGTVDLSLVSAEVVLGSLKGKVYDDRSNDGLPATSEAGIADVVVNLSGYSFGPNGIDDGGVNDILAGGSKDDGVPFSISTKTDASGNYCFGPIGVANPVCATPIYAGAGASGAVIPDFAGLPRGKFQVSEVQPTAYLDGKEDPVTGGLRAVTLGTLGTVAADAYNDPSLGLDGHATDYNFGELSPITISGTAFIDKGTLNGTYEAGTDALLAGSILLLTGTDDLGAAVSQTFTTTATGVYNFTKLRPGTYKISETNPTGYIDSLGGSVQAGTGILAGAGTIGTSLVDAITVTSGETGINYNFGDISNDVDLTLTKTADKAVVMTGEGYSYALSAKNIAGYASSGTITVSDTIDAAKLNITALTPGSNWTCTLDGVSAASAAYPLTTGTVAVSCTSATSLAGGASDVVVTALSVKPTATLLAGVASKTYTNTASISGGGETATLTSNNSGSVDVTINAPAMISVNKISIGGTGSFDFTGTNGLPTAATTITTVATGTPATVAAVTSIPLTAFNTATVITEGALPTGWSMTSAVCTGLASGDVATVDTAARTASIPATSVVAGAELACTFTNGLASTVSGNVFDDTNGLGGAPVNTVDGTGTNAGANTLRAYLIKDGKVLESATVSATGSYSISNVPAATGYSIVLADTPSIVAIGQSAPAASLPTGWANVGEHIGTTAGSDGTVNGVSASFDVTSATTTDINFGIEQPPVAGTATAANQPNPGGTTTVAVPAGLFVGTVPSGASGSTASDTMAVTGIRITALPNDVTSITLKGVSYGSCAGCTAFPATGVTLSITDLSSISIDPVDGGVTPVIAYVAIDAAGLESATGSVNIPLGALSVTGTVFNDSNGLAGVPLNTVDGTGSNAGASSLTAYLVQNGTVVGSAKVSASGGYSINNVPVGTGYSVVLADTPTAIANGQPAPGASLPSGWVNTGENTGASAGSDGSIDGKSASFDIGTSSQSAVNFGIEQPPVAGNATAASQANPGGTTAIVVPAALFTGALPSDATGTNARDATAVTAIKLTAFPVNASAISITVGGVTTVYGPGNTAFPSTGITIPVADLGSLSFDPKDDVTDVSFAYVALDAAGQGSAPGSVTMPLQTIDLAIEKSATGPFVKTVSGSGYALKVSNLGKAASAGVLTVADILPAGISYTSGSLSMTGSATSSSVACSFAGQSLTCTSAAGFSLAGGAGFTVAFQVDIAVSAGTPCATGTAADCVTNSAALSGGGDGIPANNQSSVTSALVSGPDLVLKKTALTSLITVNNPAKFALAVSNIGPLAAPFGSPAPVITVTDTLPANLEYVSATGTGWTCSSSGVVTAGQIIACTTTQTIAANGGTASLITITTKALPALAGQNALNTATVQGGGEPITNYDSATVANSGTAAANNASSASVKVQAAASLTGTVWRDSNHDRELSADGSEPRIAGMIVEIVDPATGVIVASTVTNTSGVYKFDNLTPGVALKVQFRDPATGNLAPSAPTNNEQTPNTKPGSTTTLSGGATSQIQSTGDGLLVTLAAGDTLTNQGLPLDPSGVIYDSISRQPIGGANVTLLRNGVAVPTSELIGYAPGATSNTITTCGPAASPSCALPGAYQFVLASTAPAGTYTLAVTATGYSASSYLPVTAALYTPTGAAGTAVSINTQNLSGNPPPQTGQDTTYYLAFALTPGSSPNVVNNHIPLDSNLKPALSISKSGDRSQVSIGDTVRYTLVVRRTDAGTTPLSSLSVTDTLPAGFRYIPGTLSVNGTPVTDSQIGLTSKGPVLPFLVDFAKAPLNATTTTGLAAGGTTSIAYRVRIGVGSVEGTGINRAQAKLQAQIDCASSATACSNEAQYKVKVSGGVFTSQACIVGKVFVDGNNNQIQDAEELGIPSVRLFLNDGTFVVSDSEGKYSLCDLEPKTWVLKVDATTLPKGSHLVTSSSRNAGDANSLFLDLKNGELMRADFIEGSASKAVLDEVKARRTQGEIHIPAAGALQRGLPGKATANQVQKSREGQNSPQSEPMKGAGK